MNVNALTGYSLPAIEDSFGEQKQEAAVGQPTFLDVFKNIYSDAVETEAQKQSDMISLMLGETDDISQVQLNIQKAEMANNLFITVKNTVFEAYNEIIRMNV